MIEVQSLSRFYGSRCAVDGVSFSIHANEVVGFLGNHDEGRIVLGLLGGHQSRPRKNLVPHRFAQEVAMLLQIANHGLPRVPRIRVLP